MLYKKPKLKSCSASDILEVIGPCQNQYTTTLYTTTGNSTVNVDGNIATGLGLYMAVTNGNLSVGDGVDDADVRVFVGFDISTLQGRTIVSATLRIYQYGTTGSPYSDFGVPLIVDHVNFGNSLDANATDYSGGTLDTNIGTISSNATVEWKTLDVKSYLQADLNNALTSSQYRIYFNESSSDGTEDIAKFESAEDTGGTGNMPKLVVTYN